jgi:GNAT superfamily N-acetyltransferase
MDVRKLTKLDFQSVISLNDRVIGEGYMTEDDLLGCIPENSSGCSLVVYNNDKLIGFRITRSPGEFDLDENLTTDMWDCDKDKVCYFETAVVEEEYRGKGVGQLMLKESIKLVKQLGGVAGAAHIWMQSPNNSSVKYFTNAGGKPIRVRLNFWGNSHSEEVPCTRCGSHCKCDALEMILYFGDQ